MNLRRRFSSLSRRKPEPEKLEEMQLGLLEESSLDINYLVLIIGSCAIATFGLLSNSAAVIIGAMIVAPLMLPIRGLAFAALAGDVSCFRRSVTAIVTGTLVAVSFLAHSLFVGNQQDRDAPLLAWLIGFLVRVPEFGSEVLARSQPTLLDLGIAIAAGGISGFAKVEPKIASSLAGTAIAEDTGFEGTSNP